MSVEREKGREGGGRERGKEGGSGSFPTTFLWQQLSKSQKVTIGDEGLNRKLTNCMNRCQRSFCFSILRCGGHRLPQKLRRSQ